MLTTLELVALAIGVAALVLVFSVVKVLRAKKTGEGDDMLESMINGFDFVLPPQVDEFRQLKEKVPEQMNEETMKILCSALFRRAVADIPLIRKIQTEAQGMHRLKTNDLIKDGSFMSFKMAEEMIGEEIKDVREEANALQPQDNWGDSIFAQAVQFINHMSEQEQLAEQKKLQEQMQAQQESQKQAQMQAQMAAQMQAQMAAQAQSTNNTDKDAALRKRK